MPNEPCKLLAAQHTFPLEYLDVATRGLGTRIGAVFRIPLFR